MKHSDLRRILLRLFIIFLCLSAGLAIVAVLGGGFGEVQLKIILSTLAIAAANICAMSCAAYMQRRGQNPAGITGIVSAVAAAVMVLGGIWGEANAEGYWKLALSLIVAAVAFAHGCGLLVPLLPREYRWTQTGGIITAALLAAMILGPIWTGAGSSEYYRFMAVVVIVGVLFSLLVPILSKLKGTAAAPAMAGAATPPPRLVLELISPGLYRDQTGACFNVQPADAVSGAEPFPML